MKYEDSPNYFHYSIRVSLILTTSIGVLSSIKCLFATSCLPADNVIGYIKAASCLKYMKTNLFVKVPGRLLYVCTEATSSKLDFSLNYVIVGYLHGRSIALCVVFLVTAL